MEKDVCKIKIGDEQDSGFFCKIPFPDKNNMLPVLMTNNFNINRELLYKKDSKIKISIKESNESKVIDLNNRRKYTNSEYGITIIETKEADNINDYLELDDIIINDILNNDNKTYNFLYETIYIIQYPKGELSVSYGTLDAINEDKKYNFNHKCKAEIGSSGSPILNLNNKVIGILKDNFNEGTFLNYPIKEFIKLFKSFHDDNYMNFERNDTLLNELNLRYDLDIEGTKIENLDLSYKYLGNKGQEDLSKIEFKELKQLNLGDNKISDINALEKAKFEKLEILSLGNNGLSDINILEKVNFKELKKLDLYSNDISDISVLEKVKFEKLEILNLDENQLYDVNILENVNFKQLKELDLSHNNI